MLTPTSSAATFAHWQPRYAEHGIPTFPVRNKKPLVKRFLETSPAASKAYASKFPTAEAFGFPYGPKSEITVLDIDSKNPRHVDEAASIFGRSPVLWRTGSGNFAMPFRHNGEGRQIRPIEGLPVDVLGGGFAVAPPSKSAKGLYEFIEGGLPDLGRLPVLQLPANLRPANENRIPKGWRDDWLFKRLLREFATAMISRPCLTLPAPSMSNVCRQ